jgi:hypothetical protein
MDRVAQRIEGFKIIIRVFHFGRRSLILILVEFQRIFYQQQVITKERMRFWRIQGVRNSERIF